MVFLLYTAEMGRNAYQGIGTEYETLLGAFDKDNESFSKRIGIDRADGSYKVRVRSRNHLVKFIKKCYKRSDISMKFICSVSGNRWGVSDIRFHKRLC